jgi:hypothetical protein
LTIKSTKKIYNKQIENNNIIFSDEDVSMKSYESEEDKEYC